MPDCPKVPYPSSRAAASALVRIREASAARGLRAPVAVHPCPACHWWHATSTPAAGATAKRWQVLAGLGEPQLGKTTMLNALAGAIPGRERVSTCEEGFELALGELQRKERSAPDASRSDQRMQSDLQQRELRERRATSPGLRERRRRALVTDDKG